MWLKTVVILSALSVALSTAGCGSKQSTESEKKLAEMQKQLDDTKKQLDDSKAGQPAQGQPAQQATAPSPAGQAKPVETAAARPESTPATPPPPPPPPPPKVFTLPAGTTVPVMTITALSTKTAQNGQVFQATLAQDLVVDGTVVARKGADVTGAVVSSDPGGKVKGVATLGVALRSLTAANGERIPIQTGNHTAEAKKSVKKDVVRGGIMTGAGAAIGAIAGGGKGAAIGAGIGAGAGVGTAMMTKGEPASIPAETALTFKLSAPASITMKQSATRQAPPQ